MGNEIFLGACAAFGVLGLVLFVIGLAQGNLTMIIGGLVLAVVSAFLFYTGWLERTKKHRPLRRAHQT